MRYPTVKQISIGYIPKEDRLLLMLTLKDETARKALISRRMLALMLKKISEKLASSSPTASRTPNPDEVLQMEYIAAVVNRKPQSADQQVFEADVKTYYITEVQLEPQPDSLIIGFKGEQRHPDGYETEPVAALGLARTEAHQILRMLRDQADKAGWGLGEFAGWMRPMEYGKGGD